MNIRSLLSLGLLGYCLLIFTSCLDEAYFGLVDGKNIIKITVEGQSGNAFIDNDSLIATVRVSENQDITQVKLLELEVSSLARVSPEEGAVVDFSDPVTFEVTAEDGSKANWLVTVEKQGSKPQLSNSDFNQWYPTSGGYMEPGADEATTLWATGNAGVVTLAPANTTPEDLGGGNFAARLETISLPVIFGSPALAAGSIFIGEFEVNISNPAASAKFGKAFTGRPKGFKVTYQYTPGAKNQDANKDPLPYSDQAYIWVTLEIRDGSDISRVASGWFRTEETVTDWQLLEVDLVYGELPSSAPDYIKIKSGETYADPNATPTHISVVFTSSADGDKFEGAPGSLMLVDDFELVY